ncbi:MAG TPA: TetR/AcrR family transcriptional regulator, partial [Streptosporangiaceae bacterium]
MEFSAVANHRKAIRAEIARYAERFRADQVEALSALTERYGIDSGTCPPAVLAVLMTSITRIISMEQALGMSAGHDETLALVEQYLQRLEGDPRR